MRTDSESFRSRGHRGGRHFLRAGSLLPLVALVLALSGFLAGSRGAPATELCAVRCGVSGALGLKTADRARLLPALRLSGGRGSDLVKGTESGEWQGDDTGRGLEEVAARGFGSGSREGGDGDGVILEGRGEDDEGGDGVDPEESLDDLFPEVAEEKEWITSRGGAVPDNPEALLEMADTILHMATFTPQGEEPESPERLQERSKQGNYPQPSTPEPHPLNPKPSPLAPHPLTPHPPTLPPTPQSKTAAIIARELLRRALFLSPSHTPSVCILADLQMQTGATEEAEALFEKASRSPLHPQFSPFNPQPSTLNPLP